MIRSLALLAIGATGGILATLAALAVIALGPRPARIELRPEHRAALDAAASDWADPTAGGPRA